VHVKKADRVYDRLWANYEGAESHDGQLRCFVVSLSHSLSILLFLLATIHLDPLALSLPFFWLSLAHCFL